MAQPMARPMERGKDGLTWVVLTQGTRADELGAAVRSVAGSPVVVVVNGTLPGSPSTEVGPEWLEIGHNVGVPAGRDRGVAATSSPVVAFLDDDARASFDISRRIMEAFDGDPRLGAVALRLVDEDGATARRHVPRLGGRDPGESGEVALFLGGACAVRRAAYEQAGGYWGDLFYGHEELELCWRLADHGWSIRYLADATVFHPRTDIGRHADGWRLTGRNRVMIARRTLPLAIAACHVVFWLIVGLVRAPGRAARRAYLAGWASGWRQPVDRSPIHWRTVWRLARLGRPPIV